MLSPQRRRNDLGGGSLASWASAASPEFPDQKAWERVARRAAAESGSCAAASSPGEESRRESELFLAPSSPDDDFPGQKAWERVALLRWMRDGGMESHVGSLRHAGIKRVEDLARHGDMDGIVRTLGLTPTKANLFLARTAAPAIAPDEQADAGWLVGSPCGASGFDRGGALLSGFNQPCFDDDADADDALADASELLLQAAVGGDIANLEQLVCVRGIDLNHSREDDLSSTTPLMFAAFAHHWEVMTLLVQKGADYQCRDI
jgi:hypothetical protein